MEVDPIMVVLQAIPFAVCMLGLHFIIFKPMLALLAEREKNIFGFANDADLLKEEVEAKMTELDTRLADAKVSASSERNRLRKDSALAEQEILGAARGKAEAFLAESRAAVETEKITARAQLRITAQELSSQMAQAVLGRPVKGN